MKKTGLYFSLALLAFNASASAQEINSEENTPNELLAETLSLSYGAPVEIYIDENRCQVDYSAVEIKEIENQATETAEPAQKNEAAAEPKTIITPIDKTTAYCSKIGDFNGLPQYRLTNTSINRLLAQIYNHFSIPLVKNITAESFSEEQTIVPQLGLISSERMALNKAVYTENDEESGLKKESGNLQKLTIKKDIIHQGQNVKYLTDLQLNKLNILFPMFALRLNSEHQATEVVYADSAENPFDYTNLWQNLAAFVSSRSRAVINGVSLKSDFLGFGLSYDMEMKSQSQVKPDGILDSTGIIEVNHLSFTGDMLEKHQQPQSIIIKSELNNLKLQNILQLGKVQQEFMEDESSEIDEEKLIAILDEILDTSNIITDVKVNFAQAHINAHFDFYRKNNFLQGEGILKINNLFNIFPEFKKCAQNSNAPECAQNAVYQELVPYIDLSKNISVNKLKYTEQGIFLNNKKIAEPVEIDLHKIIQDSADDNERDDSLNETDESSAENEI